MTERARRLSHLLVRLVAAVNLVDIGLETAFPKYARTVANGPFGGITTAWMGLSSLLLPLYVGFEGWWMRKGKVENSKALWIDATFAVAWFLVFWVGVLYVFTHHVPF
jgi:hypothetical protein